MTLPLSSELWRRDSPADNRHLAAHATHFFAPTLAIVGGLLAQDVLRVLSHKDTPIANLLVVDSLSGAGVVSRWAMAPV